VIDSSHDEAGWPEHLPVGSLRISRWSGHYDPTVAFYRDVLGLPVLETFEASHGEDGTILGLPGSRVHLEILRAREGGGSGLEEIVLYLPDAASRDRLSARFESAGIQPVEQIDYWDTHGAVSYADPDGRRVVLAPWVYAPDR
jgi:catechol 2,3-dioxygenase-like lactoylglutathione lyase family enzyme